MLAAFRPRVHSGLTSNKINILALGTTDYIHLYTHPNRFNWMRASCLLLCLQKNGRCFCGRVYIFLCICQFDVDINLLSDI